MSKKLPKLIDISFAWFDLWFGVYIDPANYTFYFCFFTILFTFIYPPAWKLPTKRKFVLWRAYETASKEQLQKVMEDAFEITHMGEK